jgi:hypothetical protein
MDRRPPAVAADRRPTHHVHRVHRWAAGAAGTGLVAFGVAGVALAHMIGPTSGVVIGGVFTDDVLSGLSILVGAVLCAAALRGGRTASTTLVVTGPLFLVSGLGNAALIGTPLNMIGFQASDVVFSLCVGATLSVLGSYGRFTGALPQDGPYSRPQAFADPGGVRPGQSLAVRRLAQAEGAVASGVATPAQRAGVLAARRFRSPQERLDAFTAADVDTPAPNNPSALAG